MPTNDKKLSLICFSGEFDKAIAAFTLASGAAATNYEVNVFFTFWGLNLVKNKKGRRFVGKGFLGRVFGFLMGGIKKAPLSRFNFKGISPRLMSGMMKKSNVATLEELFEAAKALKVNLYACEMSMHILGITKSDFIPEIKEVLGVAKFMELSNDGQTLFI